MGDGEEELLEFLRKCHGTRYICNLHNTITLLSVAIYAQLGNYEQVNKQMNTSVRQTLRTNDLEENLC